MFEKRPYSDTIGAQLSPETFDPRKMDANFLEANFERGKVQIAKCKGCPNWCFFNTCNPW